MDIRNYYTGSKNSKTSSQKNGDEIANLVVEPGPSSTRTDSESKNLKIVSAPKDLASTSTGEPIYQIILKTYPKTNGRCFRSEWYKKFKWLEYSPEKDASYCYVCRQFQPHGTKENAFTSTGFKNWKNALDNVRGFSKHEKSETHLHAISLWEEKKLRINSDTSVSTLVNANVLDKHRYYVKSIAEVIQFLAVNELALRGSYDLEEHAERGLFSKLFEYTLKKDKYLAECQAIVPKNAKYTSPEIQNQVIEIMAQIVQKNIAESIQKADVKWFTLLEDGTRDKNNRENIAIGIRYILNGNIKESLLAITTTKKLDAGTFTEETLNILRKNNINSDYLLSQCYDGASVMSGKVSGVAAKIQKELQRTIPYVHCYNHRLHLVVIKTISEITLLRHFFDICVALHEFFQHAKVAEMYVGKTVGRLLEQRWSGHLKVAKVILGNFNEIFNTLNSIPKEKFSCGDIAKSFGLKATMEKMDFRFALVVINKLLGLLSSANSALQSRTIGLKEAARIVMLSTEEISKQRTEENFNLLYNETTNLLPNDSNHDSAPASKRRKIISSAMKDFIVTEVLPSTSAVNYSTKQNFQAMYFEAIDVILTELNARFNQNNELIEGISTVEDLDFDKLQVLSNLGISIPSKEEILVVKSYLNRCQAEEGTTLSKVFKVKDAFRNTYETLAAVATFGCSTAMCESSFSVLTAINRPQRYSMDHQRMADLVYIAFEKKETEKIDLEEVLTKFNNRKHRRLQLY